MTRHRICGVILGGGNATRMGAEKAFVRLGGQPLLAHVIARFAPQVALLALSANGDPGRFAGFGLQVFPDRTGDADGARQGPLAGIIAALQFARRQGFDRLATVPADAPFLPLDLVARLAAASGADTNLCLAQGGNGLEPLFGLWRTRALEPAETAFAAGERAIHRLAAALGHSVALFTGAAGASAFLNLNTPGDVKTAEAALARALRRGR